MGVIMVPEIDSFNGREIDKTIQGVISGQKRDGVHDDNDHESRDGARIFHTEVFKCSKLSSLDNSSNMQGGHTPRIRVTQFKGRLKKLKIHKSKSINKTVDKLQKKY